MYDIVLFALARISLGLMVGSILAFVAFVLLAATPTEKTEMRQELTKAVLNSMLILLISVGLFLATVLIR